MADAWCGCVCVWADGRRIVVQYSHWSCNLPKIDYADCVLIDQYNRWHNGFYCDSEQRVVCQSQSHLFAA